MKTNVPEQLTQLGFWLAEIPEDLTFDATLAKFYDPFQVAVKRFAPGPNEWGGGEYWKYTISKDGEVLKEAEGDLNRIDLAGSLQFFFATEYGTVSDSRDA